MSRDGQSDRRIVRLLQSAGAVEASEEDYAAAAGRVKAAWEFPTARAGGPRAGRGAVDRRRCWLAAASVAAVLLGVAAVLLTLRPTTAWAEFQAAAEASGHFRGWVCVRADAPGAPPLIMFNTEHMSRCGFGRGLIEFMDHRSATHWNWSEAAGAVFVSELSQAEMEMTYDRFAARNNAVNFAEQLKNMREAVGAGNLEVRSHPDGDFTRFDIDWYRRDAGGKRETTPVDAMSYWVDPKTDLISKVRHVRRGMKPMTQVYEYNHPVVNDVYDLGVPRSAKVVDRRPTGELKDRLDAMDRRIEAGTGDGVAVVATVGHGGTPNGASMDTLEIYGRVGDRWAWAHYLVGKSDARGAGNARQKPQVAPPVGWPKVEVRDALALVKGVPPDDLFVHDGGEGFRSFKGNGGPVRGEPASVQDPAYFGVPGLCWPGRFRLRVYAPWSAASLRREGDGAVAIVVEETDRAGMKRTHLRELTLEAATGLPKTLADRGFDEKGVEREVDGWTFGANVKTPAGVWLPERWTHEFRLVGTNDWTFRKEATLKFEPDVRAAGEWVDVQRRAVGGK